MRHGVKISLSLLLILCIMALSCIPVYAAPVALTAAEELVALWSMYSNVVGFSQSYTSNGQFSAVNNPFSNDVAANNIADLYQRYCTYSGRIETVQETVDWIKTNTEIAISNQQTGAFQYSAGVTEFFDKFSTWVLEDVVGVVKDSVTGLFNSNQSWFNNELYYNISVASAMPTSAKPANGPAGLAAGAIPITAGGYYGLASIDNTQPVYICIADGHIYGWSTQRNAVFWLFTRTNGAFGDSKISYQYSDSLFYRSSAYLSNQTAATGILTFATLEEAGEYYSSLTGAIERIQLRPKDKYNEDVLDIPDVSSPDYVGDRTIEGVTSIPWDESISLDDILSGVLTKTLANEDVLTDEAPAPEPVISPLIPFDFPSFEFNFSGIWYYVVQWIGSLRSGFSFIASTWASLPFAMVIPIYASAVVVIVVGTFKRFFS